MIIGLGSGRCGTTSLADLLGIPHENCMLPWDFHEGRFRLAVHRAEHFGGDVGFYYLNYVDRILQWKPKTKFVCLKRNRADTIRSWSKHMVGRDYFGWTGIMVRGGQNETFEAMPTFGEVPVEEGAPRYYDLYYEKARRLQEAHPSSFRVFGMDVLNERKAQRELLRFVGRPYQKVQLGVKKNPKWQDGNSEWKNLVMKIARQVADGDEAQLSEEDSTRLAEIAKKRFPGQYEQWNINVTVQAR
jgi:hypothetical protein